MSAHVDLSNRFEEGLICQQAFFETLVQVVTVQINNVVKGLNLFKR